MKRIPKIRSLAPRASADTLGGDWLRDLRAAVALNVALERILTDAERAA